ncbi:polysaccharide deacetylase family protein [Haliangium sp.]|uniref:polysaccharide deacetylase family protein n=1 Tax=Haliangium sp. TaxID=2663208 RepID=UPI003D0BC98A
MKQLLKRRVVELCSHRPLRRVICWRVPERHHQVALTFDDGPHPVYTPQTLDVLAEHDIRATFFVLGESIENNPEVFRRMVAEGHEIGMHGYVHDYRNMAEQAPRLLDVLAEYGVTPTTFRPPNGVLEPRTGLWMMRRGYSMVFWSVDGRDSMRHEGKDDHHQPYEDIGPGDIVLLHDDNPVCVEDLREIIAIIRRKGLGTARVSEFLNAD